MKKLTLIRNYFKKGEVLYRDLAAEEYRKDLQDRSEEYLIEN